MERKSMGSFIAALRKSKGMTQQDVADRLNVSNKTVSKWERDDGYPEITMIPAIAELFDVTSDEILRGERIAEETGKEKTAVKVEKQIRFLLNQAVTRFKNMSFVAMAVIFAGLNCMFTISYAAYRPIIGFGVMLALVAAGIITQLIAINGILSVLRGNELVAEGGGHAANAPLIYRYSSTAFALAVFSIVMSLPLVLVRNSHYIESVLRFGEYMRMLPWLLLAAGAFCLIGNAAARKYFEAFLPETVSSDQKKKVSALRKKYAVILVALLVVTAAVQFAANNLVKLPAGQQFETWEEMGEFIAQAAQYERSKAAALRNGWIVLAENQINPGQENVFHIQLRYENIASYDRDNLRVYYWHNYDTLTAKRQAIAGGFRMIYLIEIAAAGLVYLRRKAKLC